MQACQRSSGNVSPRDSGGVGGTVVSPFDAPRNFGKRCASAGSPTASASVAPARYGPLSRAAAAPASTPAIAPATVAAASTAASGGPVPSSPSSFAVVYAPTAISAPWPSEIWPLSPVSTVSPATATNEYAIVASCRSLNWLRRPLATYRRTPATAAIARCRSKVCLNTARPRVREQPVRAHHERGHEDHQRAQRDHLGARVAGDVAEREPEDQAADE